MREHDNVETVRAAYAAWQRGDIAAVLDSLTDDVEWVTPGPRDVMPWAGLWRGRAEMTRYFATLGDAVEFVQYEFDQFVAQGDQVVVTGHSSVRVKATGTSFDDQWAHWFEFRGDKVARMRYYSDTSAAVAALSGARQPAQGR